MARKIELKTSADGGQALAVLEKIIKKERKISDELRKQARVSKSTSKSVMSDFGSMGGSLLQFAAGFATVATATRLMGAEIAQVQERWATAAKTITASGGDFFGALSALPEQISKLGKPFLDSVIKDAQDAGRIAQREVLKTLEQVGSNIGAGSAESFRSFVTTAARVSGVTTGPDAPVFGAGLVKVAKLAGLEGDAEAALGRIIQLGQVTNIPSVAVQLKNIPSSLARIGAEPSFTGRARLFAALARSSFDVTGERSGTGAAQLAASLRTTALVRDPLTGALVPLPEEAVKGRTTIQIAESLRDILEAETGPGLETERGRRLRRAEVVKAVGGEKTTQSFLSGILTRDPVVEANIQLARSTITEAKTEEDRAALRRLGAEQITKTEALPQVAALRLQRAFKAAAEQAQLADPAGAIRGILKTGIGELMKSLPTEGALSTSLEGLHTLLDENAPNALQRALTTLIEIQTRSRPARMPLPRRIAPGGFGDAGFGGGFVGVSGPVVTTGDPQIVNILQTLIEALQEFREGQREQTEILKKNGNGAGGRFRPADNNDFE